MFIISKGFGFLGLGIPLALVYPCELLFTHTFGDEYRKPFLDISFFLISAICVWIVGKRLNRPPKKEEQIIERVDELKYKKKHTFFFVPLEYVSWFWIMAGMYNIFK